MNLINNAISDLESIKEKSNLKNFLEEYKKMFEQLSKERDCRIKVIEGLKSKLLEMRQHNLEIEQSSDYKQIKENYGKEYRKTNDISLFYIMVWDYSTEDAYKKRDEERNRINSKFFDELEKLGYIKEEIVCGREYEIDNYIKSIYKKYICEEFGHEYVRHDNGKVEVVMEGYEGPEYEFDAFERCVGLASAGRHGIPVVKCKCCGEKIYGNIFNGDIFEPDFLDKQKVLLKRDK